MKDVNGGAWELKEYQENILRLMTEAWQDIKSIVQFKQEVIYEIAKEKRIRRSWIVCRDSTVNSQVMNNRPLQVMARSSL